jgi:alpha-mannosidase
VNFTHLTALMPCRTLEDMARVRTAEPAAQILSAWTALWHPTLVGTAGVLPHWAPAETPPEQPAGHLLLVPPAAEELLPAGWLDQARQSGAVVLGNLRRRDEMIAAALAHVAGGPATIDPDLTADFLALGFCHFIVEVVTQQMRYMTNLDEPAFERELVAAAVAAQSGDADTARARLQAAFDLLHTAREYYGYSSDSYLLDLTLVAETTLGASFREAIATSPLPLGEAPASGYPGVRGPEAEARGRPINLLISGRVLEEMARREPDSLALLRRAVEAGAAAVVGGEFHELELPLLPLEAIRYQLEKGLATYQQRLGCRPLVFGRRRFGMTPVLPQIVQRLGFTGVLHATLDDGRFPADPPSRVRWEGIDGTAVEALLRVPLDISRPDAFLRLATNLTSTMSGDYAATAIFAHWPGHGSPWYSDIQRIARHTTILGTFVTLSDYFERGGYLGQQRQHKADEYRSPYLRQAVEPPADGARRDPISRWVRYFSRRAAAEAIQTLSTLEQLVSPPGTDRRMVAGEAPTTTPCVVPDPGLRVGPAVMAGDSVCGFAGMMSPLLAQVDDSLAAGSPDDPALDDRLRRELQQATAGFSRSVSRPAEAQPSGVLVANPWSFPQRLCLELPELAAVPEAAEPVRWAAESAGRKAVVVEVPSLGFAWIGPENPPPAGSGTPGPLVRRGSPDPAAAGSRRWGLFRRRVAEPPPMAQLVAQLPAGGSARGASAGKAGAAVTGPGAALLRNELLEVHVDPHTGAIRGVFDHKSRGPRLAQQLALRLPGASGDADDAYSIMAADDLAVTSPGPVLGEVVVRGRLLDRQGRRVAGFRQTTRIWRGSRIIELDIELEPDEPLGPDPWNSYYASRLAWADDSASFYRSVNQAVLPTDVTQMEAPHLIDIRGEKAHTTLLCGGLPYHRRYGTRKLDTLLLVRGETCRRFRLGLGLDLPQPMAAATAFLAPRAVAAGCARPANAAGWLFHLDARGVLATHWEPVLEGGGQWEGESPRTASGGFSEPDEARITGFRVRLLEIDGRSITVGLRSFRAVQSAKKLSRPSEPPTDLPVEGDRIALALGPHEWAEIEARF